MHDDIQPSDSTAAENLIRLDDFLKFCGVVGTGGQAKVLIQAGEVTVNGEVETRRRRRLNPGDVVRLLGEPFVVQSL